MAIDISKYDNLALVLEKDEIQNIMRIVSEMNTFGKNETKPISRCVEVALSMIEQCERTPRIFVSDEIKAPHFLPSPTSQSVITLCEEMEIFDEGEKREAHPEEMEFNDPRGIWEKMEECPKYAVSRDCRVKNISTGRILSSNKKGDAIYCWLIEKGKHNNVNISRLAEKYFPAEKEPEYDYSDESWKTIEGFCMYEVSDMGRVRDYGEKMTEIKVNESGDTVVTMTNDDGVDKTVAVRYLVANAFIPDRFGYKYVVNRNGNLRDNRLQNIMRVSELPNSDTKTVLGKKKKRLKRAMRTERFGVVVNESEWFKNTVLAAKRIGVTQPAIKYHLDNGKPFRNGATVRKATELEYEKKGVC